MLNSDSWPSTEELRKSLQLHSNEMKSDHDKKRMQEGKLCWHCGVCLCHLVLSCKFETAVNCYNFRAMSKSRSAGQKQ